MTQKASATQTVFTSAIQHHRAGLLTEAERLYLLVLAIEPCHAESLHLLGVVTWQTGRHDRAVDMIRGAVAINPRDASYHVNLGGVLQEQGRLDEAVACYRKAIELRPNFSQAHGNLGGALRGQGRLDEAVACCRKAIELRPLDAWAHSNLGTTLQKQGWSAGAIACYRRAIVLRPGYAEAHSNLGAALLEQGRLAEAIACQRRAIELRPNYAWAHSNLGAALQKLGRLAEAIACYRRAIVLKPDLAEAHGNLGCALREQGWPEGAHQAFEQAIACDPRRGFFHRMLAATGSVAPTSPQVRQMEALLADPGALPEAERIELHFALGAVHENASQVEAAFRHLLIGNRLKRTRVAYDEAATLALFERIRAAFTAELLTARQGRGVGSRLPVFVVGMPRSGTTLVEQILASHPQIVGAGEILTLPRVVETLVRGGAAFPEAVASLPRERLDRLGAAYLDALRALAPTAARIVDKLPENFLRVGLIHLALPGARIVRVLRDPIDTCLSCFSLLFTGHLPYTYDLAELGRYYRAYDALMQHWRAILPPGIMLELRYEDLVADLQTQARRLIAHAGLTWDEACLNFHRNRRPVRTASATQVRRPLYGSSVGRWKKFADVARPLLEALEAPPQQEPK